MLPGGISQAEVQDAARPTESCLPAGTRVGESADSTTTASAANPTFSQSVNPTRNIVILLLSYLFLCKDKFEKKCVQFNLFVERMLVK